MPPPAPDLYSELANGGKLEMLAMGHDRWKPYAAATLIALFFSGTSLLSAAAFDSGLNPIVFTVYRQAFAAATQTAAAIVFERKRAPPLSIKGLALLFIHAFGMSLSLVAFHVALSCTSATLVSAATNSVPVVTFFLSVLFRLERVKLKSIRGMAKVAGIALCAAGVAETAFYEGPVFGSLIHRRAPRSGSGAIPAPVAPSWHSKKGLVKGSFILLVGNAAWALWLIFYGRVSNGYSASKITLMAIECFFAAIQAFGFAAAAVPEPARWKLRLDSGLVAGLVAIVYSGMFVSAASLYLQGYCVEKKGPVFPTLFYPLAMIFTMLVSFFLPAKTVNLGSVIGGVLMAGGLYSVLWGKGKEGGAEHGVEDKVEGEDCKDVDAQAAATADEGPTQPSPAAPV